jgi:hypothetical protein
MTAHEQRVAQLLVKANYSPLIPESVEVLRERLRRLREGQL